MSDTFAYLKSPLPKHNKLPNSLPLEPTPLHHHTGDKASSIRIFWGENNRKSINKGLSDAMNQQDLTEVTNDKASIFSNAQTTHDTSLPELFQVKITEGIF